MLATIAASQDRVTVRATVRRVGVYLDNHSIISLARGDRDRRERFIGSLHRGADLLFSPTNAAEIIGPQYQSSQDAIRAFLDAIGPNWFPIEGTDVMAVVEREAAGADRSSACMSTLFMNYFFAGRNIQLYGEQRLDLVEPDFFRLGFVLDWLGPQRSQIRQTLSDFDEVLSAKLAQLRAAYDRNRSGFDALLPEPRYDESHPATFVWNGLLRRLVIESKAYRYKKGDGADLCHSIVSSAFATFATLDKQWKRRVTSLPRPNRLARIYYEPELDQLVADLEAALTV
jgi:hypothetical protein